MTIDSAEATTLSVRVNSSEAARTRRMAELLGIGQSELIREALRRYLNALAAQNDAAIYEAMPLTREELALIDVQQWGPTEDWSDWDAAG